MSLLIATAVPTDPPIAGNRARIRAFIDLLKAEGVDFHVAYFDMDMHQLGETRAHCGAQRFTVIPCRPPALTRVLKSWRKRVAKRLSLPRFLSNHGLDAYRNREALARWRELVRELKPNVILVEYVYLSWLLSDLDPKIRTVIDTHDVLTDRNRKFQRVGQPLHWFSLSRRSERRGLNRASDVFAIQDHEAHFFRLYLGVRSRLHVVGHLSPPRPSNPPEKAHVVGFVGSENAMNISALEWFLEKIWRPLHQENPQLELRVAGSIGEAFDHSREGIRWLGRVPNLEAFYAECAFTINPMSVGTGLKIKTLESLLHGRGVVTTPTGAEGLESFDSRGLIICPGEDSFRAAISGLVASLEQCRVLAAASRAALKAYHAEHRARFLTVLDSGGTHLSRPTLSPLIASL